MSGRPKDSGDEMPHLRCVDPTTCDCDCLTCKRAWSAAGRPRYQSPLADGPRVRNPNDSLDVADDQADLRRAAEATPRRLTPGELAEWNGPKQDGHGWRGIRLERVMELLPLLIAEVVDARAMRAALGADLTSMAMDLAADVCPDPLDPKLRQIAKILGRIRKGR